MEEVEIIQTRRGPIEKYAPSYCETVIEIASQGGHVSKMLMALKISRDTFYRWQKTHPDFKEACEYSKEISQAFYEELGLRGILGEIEKFNSMTYALIMNNKFGAEYKRGTGGGSNTEVTINQNNLSLTSEEIQTKITQKLEKLKGLGVTIGDLTHDTHTE